MRVGEKENSVSYFFKRIEYCLGSGLELLSASFVAAVCHDSKVLRFRKVPLSIVNRMVMNPCVVSNISSLCFNIFV